AEMRAVKKQAPGRKALNCFGDAFAPQRIEWLSPGPDEQRDGTTSIAQCGRDSALAWSDFGRGLEVKRGGDRFRTGVRHGAEARSRTQAPRALSPRDQIPICPLVAVR